MRATLSRGFLTLAAATLALGAVPAAAAASVAGPAQDPVPIRPNQYFTGLVNNHPPGQAVIYVICPGPVNTGHPKANQPVEVKPSVPTSTVDLGYTGSAGTHIKASLTPSATSVLLASFTSYFVKKNIPTSITLPCSGTGTVAFTPGPNSPTTRTAKLRVKFINLGA
jgi:hypothetical protein